MLNPGECRDIGRIEFEYGVAEQRMDIQMIGEFRGSVKWRHMQF